MRPGRRGTGGGARRRRALGLLGLATALLAILATPAAAFASSATPAAVPAAPFASCTNPPEAVAANEVVGGVLDPASAELPAPLNPGATSSARKATTQLDLWGWTGFAWPDYDPGSSFGSCALGQAGHAEDTVVGFVARAQLDTLVWACAATTGVARAAYDPHKYDVLSGLEGTIRDGLGEGVAKVLFPLLAACVGGWLVVTADRRGPREQARRGGGVILLGISVVLVGAWALTLGPRLDEQITQAVTWVNATINGTSPDSDPGREIGESLRTNLIEPTWRYGMFGTVDGVTPNTYGTQLLHSAAISNQERADLAADPKLAKDPQKQSTALADLADAKAQAYDKFAAQVKQSDPRAYLVMAGSHNDRRLWAATTGWIVFWGVAAIQWLASVLSIWCLVIVRLIIQAWPAVALLGLVRPRAAIRVFGIGVGAIVANLGVSAVAAVERVAMRAILSWQSGGGGIAALVLAVVVAAISLWACWPFVRCVPGMPRRIRQLSAPFSGGSRSAEVGDTDRGALPVGASAGGRHSEQGAPAEALPAEGAAGREVVPVPVPVPVPAPFQVSVPVPVPASPVPASPVPASPVPASPVPASPVPALPALRPSPVTGRASAEPSEEAPWTSVPSAEPSAVGSSRSAPGSRGLPDAPERSLESA